MSTTHKPAIVRVNSTRVRCGRYLVHRVLTEALAAGRFTVPGLSGGEQAELNSDVLKCARRLNVSQTAATRGLLGIPEIVR